jgi:hypothetical protein
MEEKSMKNGKILLSAIVLVLALAVSGVRAFTQEGPCKADMEKFCKDAKDGDRMACMKSHKADLSDACKAKMAAWKEKAAEDHPCAADMEKFCKDVKPGEGGIIACLKQHEAELSDGCKARTAEAKKKIGAFKEACRADMEKFCKDIDQGEGRPIKCLKEHEKDLADACKAKVAGHKESLRGWKTEKKESAASPAVVPVTAPEPAVTASPAAPAPAPAAAPETAPAAAPVPQTK